MHRCLLFSVLVLLCGNFVFLEMNSAVLDLPVRPFYLLEDDIGGSFNKKIGTFNRFRFFSFLKYNFIKCF
ncbi:hypothetical protein D1970_16505 [Mesobacillus zeae]|uniref:Uncharacterized protein n=1 Tax=Mesobacillus zeae TaxID=1917180 RepID=A0A398B004_9BACI|nr:hypothetical protein D1970_16505 [Mesobacillus zeae]